MQLKNYMEDAVEQMMDRILKDIDVCKCERCRMDIKALALNNLPPKYVVTEEGELYVKTNELVRQFEVDIIKAITMAAMKVRENPRH